LITSQELATLVVKHVVFHDVPNLIKTGGDATPILAEVETALDAERKQLLKDKLVTVLGSSKAYPMQFNPATSSPVPAEVRKMTKGYDGKVFIPASQKLAQYLFEQQTRAISPGLLCVIDVAVSGKSAIVLMKLERERGGRLQLEETDDGKKRFAMSVFDNLVLTEGTRLFKSAMFLRTGASDDAFRLSACDSQSSVTSSSDLAKFWVRFLGCMFLVEPRIATQQFFDSALRFVNNTVTDPVVKAEIYDSLLTEIKSNKQTFSPKKFIEEYVPDNYQNDFKEHLQEEKIPMTAFDKDTADIQNRLRRRAFQTESGAIISVPEDAIEKVEIEPNRVIVNDTVVKINK
jgi:hypothetical protein